MIDNLIFNNILYRFSDKTLNNLYACMLKNEKLDESDSLYVLSFLENRILNKTFDSLEYHEFLLNPSYRVSCLICNIHNVFGEEIASEYALQLSSLLNEDITIKSTEWFDSISISEASDIGRKILNSENYKEFQHLLTLMHLYECASCDYQQTMDDNPDYTYSDFKNTFFINGIGVKLNISSDKQIINPLYKFYDSPLEEYVTINGTMIPPAIIFATCKTEFQKEVNLEKNRYLENFVLKFEQLTYRQL
ncbi:MAG: hypothetical protein SOY92_03685 [Prevotella sp.]|nr:hypothetical protein [Prevotella sp.]MDY3945089.1 hypothetical protein [Prevotella sp.]